MHKSSRWIQLQYGGKQYSNLGAFHVNQPCRTMRDKSLEGGNYVQDFLELFSKVKQHHARDICLRIYYVHRQTNGMEIYQGYIILFLMKRLHFLQRMQIRCSGDTPPSSLLDSKWV
jgi:hypothetical protein